MKKNLFVYLAVLVSLTLACSLSANTPTTSGTEPSTEPASPGGAQVQPTPIPSAPVGFLTGLGSLDSYSMYIVSNSTGPGPADSSESSVNIQASKSLDAKLVHYRDVITSTDSPDASPTENYVYTVGNVSCTGNDTDGWNYSEVDPQAAEMQNLMQSLMDVSLVIDNPTFAGSEEMYGVPTNHFTFQVSGLGMQSGAQVVTNQGEYWLAQDGQYLVRYTLVTETQDPATQAVLHYDLTIDLTNINQPVDISLPAGCSK